MNFNIMTNLTPAAQVTVTSGIGRKVFLAILVVAVVVLVGTWLQQLGPVWLIHIYIATGFVTEPSLHIWHNLPIFPPFNFSTCDLNMELEEITVSEQLVLQIIQ